MPNKFRRLGWAAALVAAMMMVMTAAPQRADAQMPTQIDATPKGTIGLGIIGAEIGFAIPALAGLHDAWAFVVFPLIGAGGGAVAGYFLIDSNDNENAAVAMLVTGLALIIPTLVLTLAMTAYDPADDDEVDEGGDGDGDGDDGEFDEAEPEEDAAAVRLRERSSVARAGTGLLRVNNGSLQLGVPGLSVRATYSQDQLWRNGGSNPTQVHLALVTGAF